MALTTPTGMAPADQSNYLVFNRGHPHINEVNNPTNYGLRPGRSYDPVAHYQWRVDRAANNAATGDPTVTPGGGAVAGLDQ